MRSLSDNVLRLLLRLTGLLLVLVFKGFIFFRKKNVKKNLTFNLQSLVRLLCDRPCLSVNCSVIFSRNLIITKIIRRLVKYKNLMIR